MDILLRIGQKGYQPTEKLLHVPESMEGELAFISGLMGMLFIEVNQKMRDQKEDD